MERGRRVFGFDDLESFLHKGVNRYEPRDEPTINTTGRRGPCWAILIENSRSFLGLIVGDRAGVPAAGIPALFAIGIRRYRASPKVRSVVGAELPLRPVRAPRQKPKF
jgi:hypothetical protein